MKAQKIKTEREAAKAAARLAKAANWVELEKFTGKACQRFPDSPALSGLRYGCLRQLERPSEAAHAALDFLLRHPDNPSCWRSLHSVERHLVKYDKDLVAKLSRLNSERGRAALVRILVQMRNGVEAARWYEVLNREYPQQGVLGDNDFVKRLIDAKLLETALPVAWEALERNPEDAFILKSLVEVLIELAKVGFGERLNEAQALALAFLNAHPEAPEAWFAMGLYYRAASRPEQAYVFFEKYCQRFPDDPFRSAHTFDTSYVESLDPEKLFAMRKEWAERIKQLSACSPSMPLHADRQVDRRLRVGYLSPDFGRHPVGHFAKTVIFNHDPERVEVFLYSLRDPVGMDDNVSQAFRQWAGEDHWRWAVHLPSRDLVERIRSDRIDVLVDLAGHSADNRLDAILHRSAPVQVHWLGFAASTGAMEMDYRISDTITEPEGMCEHLSTEDIWRLPRGFHAIEMPEGLPEPADPPCLKNGYITFGSFNNANKIGIRTLALWSRLLLAIPTARLILKHRSMEVFASREAVRSTFAAHGVDPDRVAFKGTTVEHDAHFKLYGLMDIALDSLGYNGTTTTCDALYMGVPVLTLAGNTHASRVSASLLHQVGLDGWIASDEETFIRIAKAAAARPHALARRRASLRNDFLNSPLSDGIGLASALEDAYRDMWRRFCDAPSAQSPKTHSGKS